MSEIFEIDFAGRKLTLEVGKYAEQAGGAVLARYGDTVVMCTATSSSEIRPGIDFFPLSVDYEEKLYAVGKIPGSFSRREGRPSEHAMLTSRVIDRPLRPMFPSDLRNDVSVVCAAMSVDQDNLPEVVAMVGASAAIAISGIPFKKPIAGVSVGYVDGEYILNPNQEQREKSIINVTVAGTKDMVNMIETAANEVSEEIILKAIMLGHREVVKIAEFIDTMVEKVGKPKIKYISYEIPQEIYDSVSEIAYEDIKEALQSDNKEYRQEKLGVVYEKAFADLAEKFPDQKAFIKESLSKIEKKIIRNWIVEEDKRVDGRGINEIRTLTSEVGILPRVHGSGLFSRGQTQVLTVATLGPLGNVQKLDGLDEEEKKRYMHHYNFPSYSVGECRPSRGPGRREIGHGALAEKSLMPVLPSEEEFPYAIRLVSEVLSSNGSTSQGSVCGSTLALMDAGVPIKAPVAGISCGLVTHENGYKTMVDIQGLEDHYGDMDFKVAGTVNGITAIQVDVKADGLSPEIIAEALEKTRVARLHIINDVMLKAIDKPRAQLSKYAPKIFTITINPDKIRDVIGSGGKVINKIIEETGVRIDIEDDGRVFVSTTDEEAGRRAIQIIEGIAKEVIPGTIYTGKVMRILQFGAFVEFLPGKEGLVHISKISKERVGKVEDALKVDDIVTVKVMDIDNVGRINLSIKDALPEEEKKESVDEVKVEENNK